MGAMARPREVIDVPSGRRAFALIPILALAGVALFGLATSVYSIDSDEVGVVLRFGKVVRQEPPGLHVKAPLGIEEVRIVAIQHVYKEEFGFRTKSADVRTTYEEGEYLEESLMLTGDLNMVKVEWSVQYRIKDPIAYLFRARNVVGNIRYGSESVMRKVVGDAPFDDVITKGDELALVVHQELQALLDDYELGIEVQLLGMQHVVPPPMVLEAFNKVNEAQQESEKLVNQALQLYNEAVPVEKGKAEALVTSSEGYAIERVNRARGDAERFLSLLAEYRKAPEIMRSRLYLESMARLLPALEKKYVVDERGGTLLPLLPSPSAAAGEGGSR